MLRCSYFTDAGVGYDDGSGGDDDKSTPKQAATNLSLAGVVLSICLLVSYQL